MSVFALTSQKLTINSVQYDDHIKSAVLTVDVAQLDTTDMDSAGWTEVIGGLKSGTLAVTWNDDVADNDVDEELWALLGTVCAFTLQAVDATIGAGAPEYQGNILINQYTLGGGVGELASKSLSFPISGAITRDITP